MNVNDLDWKGTSDSLFFFSHFMEPEGSLQPPAVTETATGMVSIWKNVSDRVFDMRSDRIFPTYNFSKNFKIIIDQDYWRNKDQVLPGDALVWFTDGSRADRVRYFWQETKRKLWLSSG